MNAFLTYFRMILQILPEIIAMVKMIESHAGEVSKAGAGKLELLRALVTDAWSALDPAAREQVAVETLISGATRIANRFVAFFNAVGLFKTSAKTAA